eukprot:scaffold100864_cov45-Phaeocystis_antarctica.AAC.1
MPCSARTCSRSSTATPVRRALSIAIRAASCDAPSCGSLPGASPSSSHVAESTRCMSSSGVGLGSGATPDGPAAPGCAPATPALGLLAAVRLLFA